MEIEVVAIEIKYLIKSKYIEEWDRWEYEYNYKITVKDKWKGWLIVEEIEGVLRREISTQG